MSLSLPEQGACPLLRCRDLRFSRAGRLVLRGIDLAADPGGHVVIIGPNGAGKTTLLQCLSGLLLPQGGTVETAGRPLASFSPRQRARLIAVVPQRSDTLPRLTVGEAVLLGRYPHLARSGLYSAADYAAAREALRATRSLDLTDRPLAALSGGELQRVLLARALAQHSPILLLDELSSGLDPARLSEIFDLLEERRKAGVCCISVMHELNLAAVYATRIVGLSDGRVLFNGPADEVCTQENMRALFGVRLHPVRHPVCGRPQFCPQEAGLTLSPPASSRGTGSESAPARIGADRPAASGSCAAPAEERENPPRRTKTALFRIAARLPPLVLLCLVFCFADAGAQAANAVERSVSFTDAAGRKITLPGPARRIIPLYGAFGEMLAGMGMEHTIVARTEADAAVPALAHLPSVGTHMRPNPESAAALRPDLILLLKGRREADQQAETLRGFGFQVASFEMDSFEDLFGVLRALGLITGVPDRAAALEARLRARLQTVAARVAGRARPSVFFEVRWPNLLGAGQSSIVSEIIGRAGGRNAVETNVRLARLNEEELLRLNPDVYLMQRGPMNSTALPPDRRAHFAVLAAVRAGRVLVVEERIFSRPGPGSVLAVELLADYLHP